MPEFQYVYKERAIVYDGTNSTEVLTYFGPLHGGFDDLTHEPEPSIDENDVITIHYGGGPGDGPFDIVISPGDVLQISPDGGIAQGPFEAQPLSTLEPRIVRLDDILNP